MGQRTRVVLFALLGCAASAVAQNVKITPLGSHAGELCSRDRATIFEDPTGVRILYDAGVKIIFNYSEQLLQVPPEVTVHTSSPAVDLLYALYFYLT